jgi:hypothetical protein
VYGDEDKCDLLNKYFSLISKLEEENVPLPDFDNDMRIFPTRGIFTLTERFVKNNL